MTDDRRMDEAASAAPRSAGDDAAEERAADASVVATEAPAPTDSQPDAGGAATADAPLEAEALRAEIDELSDRHLRLAAEFDNYRKRNERDRVALGTRAQADLITRLLDALDDLQRVACYDEDGTSVAALLEGVRLVEKKFRHVLESAGLEPIDAEGEFFNPATMEALMSFPAERPEDDDLVADVFQKGYRFKEALIRPARVRVMKYESKD